MRQLYDHACLSRGVGAHRYRDVLLRSFAGPDSCGAPLIPDPDENPEGFVEGVCRAFAAAVDAIRAEADREGRVLVGADAGRIVWRLPGGRSVTESPPGWPG